MKPNTISSSSWKRIPHRGVPSGHDAKLYTPPLVEKVKGSRSLRQRWTYLIKYTHFLRVVAISLIVSLIMGITFCLWWYYFASDRRCALQEAFQKGHFQVFSHRSFVDSTQKEQPTCEEALEELKVLGIHRLDLDLVYAKSDELVVAHPIELIGTAPINSPCALHSLTEMLLFMENTFGAQNSSQWFLSLELKANWSHQKVPTGSNIFDPLSVDPAFVMELFLKTAQSLPNLLVREHCAVIVDASAIEGKIEKALLKSIAQHCQLFLGITRARPFPTSLSRAGFEYDAILPSIEFLRGHKSNNPADMHLAQHAIFWPVDNEKDLLLLADSKAIGVISDQPRKLVTSFLGNPSWCSPSAGTIRHGN